MKFLDFTSKENIYSKLIITQVVFFAILAIASEFDAFNLSEFTQNLIVFAYSCSGILYIFFFIRLLRELKIKKKYLVFSQGYFIGTILIVLFLSNPFMGFEVVGWLKVLYASLHLLAMVFWVWICSVIIKDIFTSPDTTQDHIWGAIVVYFVMILVFSEVYEVLSYVIENPLGKPYQLGWALYIQNTMFSVSNLAGLDSVYPEAISLFKKIGYLQSIIGNLFLIVILGRLLSVPLHKK